LDSKLRFVYCNPAWDKFARENDGVELMGDAVIGSQILNVIPDVLKPFYTRMFDEVRRSALVWEHVYEAPPRSAEWRKQTAGRTRFMTVIIEMTKV
jgi:hypothetical protein